MSCTYFRAYSSETVVSRMDPKRIKANKLAPPKNGKKQNIEHEVENVFAEGKVTGDKISFDSGDEVITKVVALGRDVQPNQSLNEEDAGEEEVEVVLASAEFNRAGKFNLQYIPSVEADEDDDEDLGEDSQLVEVSSSSSPASAPSSDGAIGEASGPQSS